MLNTLKVIEKLKDLGKDPRSFCLVPFTTITLEPDGLVTVCRLKGNKFHVGDLKKNTLEEIWNGEKIRLWRRSFLNNERGPCDVEITNKSCNLCSKNNQLLDSVEYAENMPFPPVKLTANFNGFCNLECQMCDVWKLPNGFYTEENFWQPAREKIFPTIKEIDMLSGEPFLQSDTFKLIDEVSSFNKDCLYTFNTNAHWRLGKKITDAFDKIVVKDLIISIDSFDDDVYAKIRKKGKLKLVLKTIQDLITYNKSRVNRGLVEIPLSLNFLVQTDNWKEVKYAINYCLENEIRPFITFCYLPSEFSLLSLPTEERLSIVQFYFENLSTVEKKYSVRILKPLIRSLEPIDKIKYLIELGELSEGTYE